MWIISFSLYCNEQPARQKGFHICPCEILSKHPQADKGNAQLLLDHVMLSEAKHLILNMSC